MFPSVQLKLCRPLQCLETHLLLWATVTTQGVTCMHCIIMCSIQASRMHLHARLSGLRAVDCIACMCHALLSETLSCAGLSRCSKAASVEMEDLSEPLALQYLEKRGVAAKAAAQVVEVTGGRMLQLMCAVEVLQGGGTSEGVRMIAIAAAVAAPKSGLALHSRLFISQTSESVLLQPLNIIRNALCVYSY